MNVLVCADLCLTENRIERVIQREDFGRQILSRLLDANHREADIIFDHTWIARLVFEHNKRSNIGAIFHPTAIVYLPLIPRAEASNALAKLGNKISDQSPKATRQWADVEIPSDHFVAFRVDLHIGTLTGAWRQRVAS